MLLMRRALAGATVAVLLLATAGTTPSVGSVPTKRYRKCNALNGVYPHGVGRPGARDKTSGRPVTNFRVSRSVYSQNTHLDRDNDRVACDQR
jgi:hypothetical protein